MLLAWLLWVMTMLPWSLACGRVYYVDQASPKARDYLAPGSAEVPFKTLAAACHKACAGDTVIVQPGVYREILTPVRSGRKDAPITFQAGGPGVWIKGSDVIGGWTREGALWVKRPWRQRMFYDAQSMDGMGMAPFHSSARMEQVFIDGKPLQWTPDRSSLQEGGFCWAADGSEIVLRLNSDMNPNAALVEIPIRPCVVAAWPETDTPRSTNEAERTQHSLESLMLPAIDWIVIRGFQFAHNAATINRSGVRVQGRHWTLEGNTVEWMNTIGIGVDDDVTLRNNLTRFNGQCGIGGTANRALLDGNTSYLDNVRDFNTSWGGCGIKLAMSSNIKIVGQGVVCTAGAGIWFDIDCYDVQIEDSAIICNRLSQAGASHGGIFYEVSYKATMAENTIFGNHWGIDGKDAYGGGITISSSTEISAKDNAIIFCDNGFSVLGIPRDAGTSRSRYWTMYHTDAYYARDVDIRNNLIVGDLTKSFGLAGKDVLSDAAANKFHLNSFLTSRSGATVFLENVPSPLAQMEASHGNIFSGNITSLDSNLPQPAADRIQLAASRMLRTLSRVSPDLPKKTIGFLSVWKFQNSEAQALAVLTERGPTWLVDVPRNGRLAIKSSQPTPPRAWMAASGQWQSLRRFVGGYYLDALPGFYLIQGIARIDEPMLPPEARQSN